MSAFICGTAHFKQLAIFASTRDHGSYHVDPRYLRHQASRSWYADAYRKGDDNCQDRLATFYADLLYQENIRSVRVRYPDDKWDELPGPIVKPLRMVITSGDSANTRMLSPVAILKLCDCLDYQSCETEDWAQTAAYELLELIRRAAIHELPGYEDAPWDHEEAA